MRLPTKRSLLAPAAGLLVLLAGCGALGPSFDPAGPCTVDGQAEGAYPLLEAALPTSFRDTPPTRVDSGRSCSTENLGTLAAHGIEELRFAGALWETDGQSGITIARFSAPRLRAEWVAEFYETGAREGRRTENVEAGSTTIAGRAAWRLDTLNDESFQSIVVWQDNVPGTVWVVLAASGIREIETRDAHDAVVSDAVATVP